MAIRLPLAKLSVWQQTALCCALLERMLPNYVMFSHAAEFGDAAILRNQLDLLWQKLDSNQKIKVNVQAQLEKLELQIPDPEAFDFFGVFPALDVCMAMMSLLQATQNKEADEFANVSRLSHNSVSYYVELVLAESMEEGEDIPVKAINEHPLMVWEKAMQDELFDFLQTAPENKATCQQLKSMALEEGLSNLGIEIDG
ncbi:YjaG family protein [Thalassotalea sp. M1531]|uniref:YjaG family protein n=1 Tax=Thalassotalea algicola TaxID=2716224 RepID=A0A7Y0Q6E7_9GAMM|nr:YjaG family protein [Thalassotalea algicola]NMP30752.1 YjaG family protein [Thalassotalea algicola]